MACQRSEGSLDEEFCYREVFNVHVVIEQNENLSKPQVVNFPRGEEARTVNPLLMHREFMG